MSMEHRIQSREEIVEAVRNAMDYDASLGLLNADAVAEIEALLDEAEALLNEAREALNNGDVDLADQKLKESMDKTEAAIKRFRELIGG